MAQGYYTLEEAAGLLGMPVDELKMMARKGDIRSFQDRGTWRFRVQDVQEMARQRGLGSEPDLVLGESLSPVPRKTSGLGRTSGVKKSGLKPGDAPRTPPPAPAAQTPPGPSPEIFAFDLDADESVNIGQEQPATGPTSSKKSGPKSNLSAPKSPPPGPKSPPPAPRKTVNLSAPEPGSDSDVRLVNDDPNVDFGIELESGVRLGETPPPAGPRSPGKSSRTRAGQGQSGLAGGQPPAPGKTRRSEVQPQPPDSGVRLVPMDSDSDVRIVGADAGTEEIPLGSPPPRAHTDSAIHLTDEPGSGSDEGVLTEEIDLDLELGEVPPPQAEAPAPPPPPPPPLGAGLPTPPAFPEQSPFELSETDFELPSTGSSFAAPAAPGGDSSSDFELLPVGESSSPVDGGEAFDLPVPDDSAEFDLGPGVEGAGGAGFSLDKPVDSGISLEQESEGSDELDFGLNIDDPSRSAPPAPVAEDSDSEFELALSPDDSSGEMSALEESSEFELTLDAGDAPGAGPVRKTITAAGASSSEFELTLDSGDESSSEFELTIDASTEAEAAPELTSDSEFELQLDETGLESSSEFELTIDDDLQLVPEEDATPQGPMDDALQTDLDDAPLLEEDTGSDVMALEEDTGLEDSDFDIQIDSEEEESSSAVVALEEEEFDLGEEEPAVGDKGLGFEDDFGELGEYGAGEVAVAEDEEAVVVEREPVIIERDVYAAPWSAWPVIVMLPCVVVMFFIGLMGFELVQSVNGYQEPGTITKAIGNLIGIDKLM